MKNNTLIYWKWDDSTLNSTIDSKIDDLCNRFNTGAVFIALHWIKRPFHDPELVSYLERCCKGLHARGKKMYIELCPRNEGDKFFKDISQDAAYLTDLKEIPLDSEGNGELTIELPDIWHYWRKVSTDDRIISVFAMEKTDQAQYKEGTLVCINDCATLEVQKDDTGQRKGVIRVKAGTSNANKTAVVFVASKQAIPDLASPDLEKLFEFMLDSVGHIPIDGVCSDEWGYDIFFDYHGDNYYEDRISIRHISVSDNFAKIYNERTGGLNLYEELIHMFYTSDRSDKRTIRAINFYFDTLRHIMAENDRMMYCLSKEKFGPDTFFGVHPTWWGSETLQYFEFFKNGFYWWDAIRDIAQTDETVALPIRTALAHKWSSPIWYNMWYSMGTRDINTYYRETWNNILYGGRTHYLGYECPNESVVLELKPEGMLESIEEMDQRVRMLDEKQTTQPDCRVLLLFSIPAASNWYLDGRPRPPFFPHNKILTKVLETARDLFRSYLCDLVPSSEIANGSLTCKDGKVTYGSQEYDAVILLQGECLEKETFDFFKNLDKNRFAVCGSYSMYSDATSMDEADKWVLKEAKAVFSEIPTVDELCSLLKEWNISPNRSSNGTVLQDGSVIYSALGDKPSGNKLDINETLGGFDIEFQGEDFLFIYSHGDSFETIYPGGGKATISRLG